MNAERTDDDRRQIGARVKQARGSQSLEAAAREAGMSSITLGRVESGLRVREDRLAAALAYAEARIVEPPASVQQASDDQLLAELARRLARTEEGDRGAQAAPIAPHVEAVVDAPDRKRVRATPARKSAPKEHHPNGS